MLQKTLHQLLSSSQLGFEYVLLTQNNVCGLRSKLNRNCIQCFNELQEHEFDEYFMIVVSLAIERCIMIRNLLLWRNDRQSRYGLWHFERLLRLNANEFCEECHFVSLQIFNEDLEKRFDVFSQMFSQEFVYPYCIF